MNEEKVWFSESVEEVLNDISDLVLHNDDINTFDHVINCLVDVCGHDSDQAEQCAWIVHLKGRCTVKTGGFHELEPPRQELLNRGLTVTIDT